MEEFTAGDKRKQFVFKQLPIDETCDVESVSSVESTETSAVEEKTSEEKETHTKKVQVKKA